MEAAPEDMEPEVPLWTPVGMVKDGTRDEPLPEPSAVLEFNLANVLVGSNVEAIRELAMEPEGTGEDEEIGNGGRI